MSRAIAILLAGCRKFVGLGIQPQVELALFRTCGRLSVRRTKRRSSFPPCGSIFSVETVPSVRETGKLDDCRVANHGPIGDSWPIAFFGHPRGHRVFIETRCLKAHRAYYGVRYSPSKPSVSGIRRISTENDPQDGTTLCPRHSSGLRLQTLGIEMRSFLPNR